MVGTEILNGVPSLSMWSIVVRSDAATAQTAFFGPVEN